MKILIIHQFYLFPGQPGGSRFNELARLWSDAGHEVTVVAGSLNYATGLVPEELRQGWVRRQVDGRTTVWRCHVPSTYSKSYVGRMWAFFGFTLSAATATVAAGVPDVVIATSPPLVTIFPGVLAARLLRRAALIFEIRDLWPESAVTTGVLRPEALLTRVLYGVERWACASADRVNVLTPAFREDLLARGLAPDFRIVFVPNGADLALFQPGPRDNEVRRQLGWGARFVVMYSGAHGRANGLHQLLEAAELLRGEPDVLIACVGDGPERAALEQETRRRGLTNLQFCGAWPKERMVDVVNACDVGAAVLCNNPTFRTIYPNKVFDYMACERPTLLAIDGVARRLVCDEANAGVFVEPENARAIADAILRLRDDAEGRREMGRQGRAWVLAHATRESLARRYLEIMTEVTQEVAARGRRGLGLRERGRTAAGLVGSLVQALRPRLAPAARPSGERAR